MTGLDEKIAETDDLRLQYFHMAYRRITELADRELAAVRLGRAHHRVLFLLRRQPGLTAGRLAQALGVTNQALNPTMRRLLERTLVTAQTPARNKRLRHHFLTPAGMSLEEALTAGQRGILHRVQESRGSEAMIIWEGVMSALAKSALPP